MSTKTTICGILAIISAGITLVAIPLLDGDPNTVANWTAFGTAAAAGVGLIFARDHTVTSEDAGLK